MRVLLASLVAIALTLGMAPSADAALSRRQSAKLFRKVVQRQFQPAGRWKPSCGDETADYSGRRKRWRIVVHCYVRDTGCSSGGDILGSVNRRTRRVRIYYESAQSDCYR